MSRFYEALKQASRSLQPGAEDSDWADSGFPSVFDQPERMASSSGSSAVGVLDDSDPLVSEPVTEKKLTLGQLTDAALDEGAPLIPNAIDPAVLEHYRLLRTKIIQVQSEKTFRSLLIASASSGEGKTVTVLNLALVFSMLPSYKVLVIDGDIRKGSLSELVNIDGRPGLGNLLEGTSTVEDVVLKSYDVPFCFVGRGTSKASPPELLHAARWQKQMQLLTRHFDLVLIDSPPVSLVADAQLLAAGADATLLVARAFKTRENALKKMSQDFRKFRVIGTVLNCGNGIGSYRRYKSYYPGKK